MTSFELVEIARLVGIPYSTMDAYVNRWILHPSIKPRRGSGHTRLFSQRDLLACFVGVLLQRQRISTESIRKAIRYCQVGNVEQRLANGERFLVANNRQCFVAKEGAIFTTEEGKSAAVVVIDLQRALDELKEKVSRRKDKQPGANVPIERAVDGSLVTA